MELLSQHEQSLANYDLLSQHHVSCELSLGVRDLSRLLGASPGVGGATLMTAEVEDIQVVIKAFPVDCRIKYRNNAPRENTNVRDYGNFEIGTCQLFTDIFILPSITQNITTFYNKSICEQAYNVPQSLCTRKDLPPLNSYPVPSDYKSGHPLAHFNTAYHDVIDNRAFVMPPRSDEVRFMMVELCDSDIQGYLEINTRKPDFNLAAFDAELTRILIMVMHTLLLFDAKLEGYSHNDLGTRNILLVKDDLMHTNPNLFWRYNFPGDFSVDIPVTTPIPKIWDFAFVRFGTADLHPEHYNYLHNSPTPKLEMMCDECRLNDVYILLNDIDVLLRTNGVTQSKYNSLDLESIRSEINNTAAVYNYFNQNPIPGELLSGNNDIIHEFPQNIEIFDNLDINRAIYNIKQ